MPKGLQLIKSLFFNPLSAELNPICHLLAVFGAHHILHFSGIRVNAGKKSVPPFQRNSGAIRFVVKSKNSPQVHLRWSRKTRSVCDGMTLWWTPCARPPTWPGLFIARALRF